MLQDFINKNKDNFKQMQFALQQRNKPMVAVVNAANEQTQKNIQNYLPKILPEYNYINIDLTGKNFGSLTNYLKTNLPEKVFENADIKHVINISGLQNLALQTKRNDQGELIFVASKVIEQINFERERIFREIPAILIFYIDSYTIEKLQKTASDFWDWINYSFKFESTEKDTFAEDFVEDENYKPEPHYTPERKAKIEELRHKLEILDKSLPEIRFFKSQINLQMSLARELTEVREFELSIENLKKALNTIEKYKINTNLIGKIYHYISYNYSNLRKFKTALDFSNKSIKWFEKTNNLSNIGSSYHQIGYVYSEQRNWNLALENHRTAIEWNEKTNNLSKIGISYHQIGYVYSEQRNWTLALENYKTAIEWNEKTNNLSEIGNSYHQIGYVYLKQQNWNLALENYKTVIEWNEKTNNLSEIGSSYHQIGYVYSEQRNWNLAIENYKTAIEWNERTNNLSKIGISYHNIGYVYSQQKNWTLALENYKTAIEWNEKTNNLSKIGVSFYNIRLVLSKTLNFRKRLKYYNDL